VAEPESITTSTLNVFPEGKDYFKEDSANTWPNKRAPQSVRKFCAQGRILQSISGVKVVKAVDDKGRTIAPAESDEEEKPRRIFRWIPPARASPIPFHPACARVAGN